MSKRKPDIDLDSRELFVNRELSWLGFAGRVLALTQDPSVPLLERVKFAGIMGMLHDEFFMKRISGLKRQIARGRRKLSLDGRSPTEEHEACRETLGSQHQSLQQILAGDILPALAGAGCPILDHSSLNESQAAHVRAYFEDSVLPILTPLAVDAEHPFPFISNLGINLAITLPHVRKGEERFIRIKVPDNRPRWVPLPDAGGFVPLEQIIASNLDLMYPESPPRRVHAFQVTRGAEGVLNQDEFDETDLRAPGAIIRQVTHELKARRFAGVVRLMVDAAMPRKQQKWIARELGLEADDVHPVEGLLGVSDLLQLAIPDHDELRYPRHQPSIHPRLRALRNAEPTAIFPEIARGDILLHHPYHSFDSSVLAFIEAAAADPTVLAIKLTIYRTSRDSPIVQALAEAARRGKQVAVIVEITARFDEAPNIAWGKFLEKEGVHVSYGVEQLKTHVKLALVVREEDGTVRQYAHVGTGNYHTGTAQIYEDLGLLTADPAVCADVSRVFNMLTGNTPPGEVPRMLVAPITMRRRFTEMIRREAENAHAGMPCGIDAKMNQLQDPEIIRELYRASRAGVPINLNVRGLCCLRPGLPGLSDSIRVFGVIGRFLEHSRVYRFVSGGEPEYFMGSADWMKRNLDNRVETIVSVSDPSVKREIDAILASYDLDNASVWDCDADGHYARRRPSDGESPREAQEILAQRVNGSIGTRADPPGAG